MIVRAFIMGVAFAVTLLAGVAQESSAPPSQIERLKAKADSMKDHDRGKIYSEIAQEFTEQANRQFSEGQMEAGRESLEQVVEFAEKASAAAKIKNKKTKDTEINLRRTARRLEEVERSLAAEHRPPVEAVVQKIDAIRKDLLEFFLKRG
jgi:hypothetical protein